MEAFRLDCVYVIVQIRELSFPRSYPTLVINSHHEGQSEPECPQNRFGDSNRWEREGFSKVRFPRVLHRTETTPSVHVKEGKLMEILRQRLPSPHIGSWHYRRATDVFGFTHKVFKFVFK